ncbi:UNVERIFIED_CONTAM: hypothetical protein Sradi_3979700 [Sesamum radiatum]|uniref:Uncharacterized protein n=1 Tax=Sesamum radiatum TaxID=300843 RepID=A0AAW2PJX5_SESRA
MFDKLFQDQIFGSPEGYLAATPPSANLKGTLASSDSRGKRPTGMTLEGSSKYVKISSSGHPSSSTPPLGSACSRATSLPPPPLLGIGGYTSRPHRYPFETLHTR